MSFYRDLASYYDELFPLNPKTTEFVCSFLKKPNNHILDIGCATGQLALELAAYKRIASVTAIEPDEKMVETLRLRIHETHPRNRMEIHTGGMLDLDTLFSTRRFDLVLCLGNTLVHLPSLADINRFFHSVYHRLNSGGVFIFQVVNYIRILNQDIRELPLIDRPRVSFQRKYTYDESAHMMRFATRMTIKETGQALDNHTLLYPLRHNEITPIIDAAGFHTELTLSTFAGQPWLPSGQALIMTLRKP